MAGGGAVGAITPYAVIGVDFEPGATVSCSGNGATYTSPSTDGHALFAVQASGTYTVTATKDEETVSGTVEVDTQYKVYTIGVYFSNYLFKEGEGGLVTFKLQSPNYSANSSIDENRIYLKSTRADGGQYPARANTVDQINVEDFNSLKIEVVSNRATPYTANGVTLALCATLPSIYTNPSTTGKSIVNMHPAVTDTKTTFTLDISSVTGSAYVVYFNNSGNDAHTITNLWLE